MVQIHIVENKNRVFFQMIAPVPDPAADIVGKIQQQFELVMYMEIVLFVGFGDFVPDREKFQCLFVFIV
jgi:hypothetical protein